MFWKLNDDDDDDDGGGGGDDDELSSNTIVCCCWLQFLWNMLLITVCICHRDDSF